MEEAPEDTAGREPGGPLGVVFDVQRFSLHDGPGIRTTVFLKGCQLRCPWCQNPESHDPRPELAFFADRCRERGRCFESCTRAALLSGPERVDRARCDVCGLCVPACPGEALQMVGRKVAVEDLLDEVARDRHFYEASGGGVTLSGGEPTAQMEFLLPFLEGCRERGLGAGLETCGAFRWSSFELVLPLLSFVYFDIKLMDKDEHRRVMGADNGEILGNARRLAESGATVAFRMPVVPGYTNTETNLEGVAAFLRELGAAEIHLLRYHAMGEGKLARLGSSRKPLELGPEARSIEPLEHAAAFFRDAGLEVKA
jgi:pyruvate formate lyase activating enzyme